MLLFDMLFEKDTQKESQASFNLEQHTPLLNPLLCSTNASFVFLMTRVMLERKGSSQQGRVIRMYTFESRVIHSFRIVFNYQGGETAFGKRRYLFLRH